MLAVLVWGAILAIGTGVGWQLKAPDARRALFVVAGVLGYCGLWWLALRYRAAGRPDAGAARWSRSALVGLAGVVGAWLSWGATAALWSADRRLAEVLGWVSVASLAVGGVAVLIALSDPVPRRGKGWALLALLLIAAAVVVFLWQALAGAAPAT